MYRGTAHVILGSGLTVAGAVLCLSFTRLPYFQSLGMPAAIGVLVALVAALTLAPAVLTVGRPFGLFDPKRAMRTRAGDASAPRSCAGPAHPGGRASRVALIGLLALPGYKTSYDPGRTCRPGRRPMVGYAAAERHFSQARLNPEVLMVESDHDMRNPADMIVLERWPRRSSAPRAWPMVQSITRPLGTPLDHTSLGFQISAQSAGQIQNLPFQQARADDMLKQVAEIVQVDRHPARSSTRCSSRLNAATDEQAKAFHETVDTIKELRDKVANFDDFFRPMRNYFYWEPHCFDIPVCAALRSLFDALDGVDALTDKLGTVTASLDKLDRPAAATGRADPRPDRRPRKPTAIWRRPTTPPSPDRSPRARRR